MTQPHRLPEGLVGARNVRGGKQRRGSSRRRRAQRVKRQREQRHVETQAVQPRRQPRALLETEGASAIAVDADDRRRRTRGPDIVVVSNMYRSAVKELGGSTSKLATVSGTVYSDESAVRPCGCLRLAVG